MEHISSMKKALNGRGSVIEVRKAGIIPECDGIVFPGGESTTIGRLLTRTGVGDEVKTAAVAGMPVLATCAGLVLVSKEIEGEMKVKPLGLMNIKVMRNAFGSQKESFEADLDVVGFSEPYHAVFIRAPAIVELGHGVEQLAAIGKKSVAVRQKSLIGLAFHPELTEDFRFHEIFLKMIGDAR